MPIRKRSLRFRISNDSRRVQRCRATRYIRTRYTIRIITRHNVTLPARWSRERLRGNAFCNLLHVYIRVRLHVHYNIIPRNPFRNLHDDGELAEITLDV